MTAFIRKRSRIVSDLAGEDTVLCVDTGEVTLWAANWMPSIARDDRIGTVDANVNIADVWKFGIGKIRELAGS